MFLRRHLNVCLLVLVLVTSARVYAEIDRTKPFSGKYVPQSQTTSSAFITKLRENVTSRVQRVLPSPHSELLLGMTIGVNLLNNVPKFRDATVETGTVHVLVVSGFNISLVFGLVISLLGSQYKLKNLLFAQAATLIYALITGFEPPVVRAWIMGSLASWGKYYGRVLPAIQVLFFAALVMLAISPGIITSKSFHLSFLATLSLVKYSNFMTKLVSKYFKIGPLGADLSTTLAAQVLVWPYISYNFGRVSLVSPVVNTLTLWTVPIATVVGLCLIAVLYVCPILGLLFADIAYIFIDIFVKVVRVFADLPFSAVDFRIGVPILSLYYLLLLICDWRFSRH